ncbi:hypothetical protein B0H13DRAFT_1063802 [Mycena leptocephala]|nr:hypothetical protein B0H13DRAFT_1063802 [Mycena leptocephala]
MPAGAWPSTSRAAWVRLHPRQAFCTWDVLFYTYDATGCWLLAQDPKIRDTPMRGRSSVDHPRTRVARRACFPTSNAAHSEFNVLQSVDSSAVLALPAPRHPHEHRILRDMHNSTSTDGAGLKVHALDGAGGSTKGPPTYRSGARTARVRAHPRLAIPLIPPPPLSFPGAHPPHSPSHSSFGTLVESTASMVIPTSPKMQHSPSQGDSSAYSSGPSTRAGDTRRRIRRRDPCELGVE